MKKIITFIFAIIAVFAAKSTEPSGTLPVIHINIENNEEIVTKEPYHNATLWLEPNNSGFDAIGSQENPVGLQIKGRGNYTFVGFDKKPYRLKFTEKQPILGMKKSKHFGLLAHADDVYGFLRNPVGFEASKLIGLAWTPEQEPVELVVNGTYRGLYFLTELIRIDEKRVNITEGVEESTDPAEITGGWLVEIDNYMEDAQVRIREDEFNEIWVTYDKSVDVASEQQRTFLTEQFMKINELVYGDKDSDELWDYLDLDALARYYLVQEITDDYESFHGSCYMFRDRGEGEKWYFGPVWDFGNAFTEDKCRPFYEGREWHNTWIGEIAKFPLFHKRVSEIWKDFQYYHFAELYAYVEEYASKISVAAVNDKERWPEYGNDDISGKAATIESRLRNAEKWLIEEFGKYSAGEVPPLHHDVPADVEGVYNVYFRDMTANPWETVTVYSWGNGENNILGDWPGSPASLVEIDGVNYWYIAIHTKGDSDGYKVIFNNGEAGKFENQTADLDLIKRGLYLRTSSEEAGIEINQLAVTGGLDVVSDGDSERLSVHGGNGELVVESDRNISLPVFTIDGRVSVLNIHSGENRFTLPRGVYIVNQKKIII